MKRRRRKRNDPRHEIRDTSSSIGTGPVTLDLDHARAWGFTDQQLGVLWAKIFKLVQRAGNVAKRRHPELYAMHPENGDIVFVGAIHDQPAWDDKRLRRAGLVRLGPRK